MIECSRTTRPEVGKSDEAFAEKGATHGEKKLVGAAWEIANERGFFPDNRDFPG
jgi:hypothetical protein